MKLSHHLWRSSIILVVCGIFVTACGNSEYEDSSAASRPRMSPASTASTADLASGMEAEMESEEVDVAQSRMMIYTADLRLRVRSVDSSHTHIMALLSRYNAYMTSDNRTSFSGQIENSVTIRVAQAQFNSLLERVLKEAVYIDKKEINASDVTQEFVDLEARLKSRQLAEEQYREILKRATKISDILEVQKHLNEIRETIEAAQGRMKYLQSQAAYSTINIVLYETEKAVAPPEETFAGRLSAALSTGWGGLQTLVIGFLSIWPFWILAALVVYVLVRFMRRRSQLQEKTDATVISAEKHNV